MDTEKITLQLKSRLFGPKRWLKLPGMDSLEIVRKLERCLFSLKVTFSDHSCHLGYPWTLQLWKWQLSHLFIEVHWTCSVWFRFNCAQMSFFHQGWKGTFSALVQEHLWKVVFFRKAGCQQGWFSERMVFRKAGFQKGWFSEKKAFRKAVFQPHFHRYSRIRPQVLGRHSTS